MEPIQIRAAFPYLNDAEFEKIEKLEDSSAEVIKARKLCDERFEKEQADLSASFVDSTNRVEVEAKGRSDLAYFEKCRSQAKGNLMAALDLFMFNKPEYRAYRNQHLINAKATRGVITYQGAAAKAGSNTFRKYKESERGFNRALMLTSDAPGAANTLDTTVAQSIIFRAEQLGNLLPLIAKVEIPYGLYAEPYYNKYGQAGYLAENGTVPDFNTYLADGTDGIKKRTWTPKDFAIGLEQSFRTLEALSPSILNNIFEIISMSLLSGMEYQAINGPGSGQTDTGFSVNATAITFAGNAYDTFVNACSSVESVNAFNISGFANAKAIGEFLKLRSITESLRDIIVPTAKGVTINGVNVFKMPETIMPTATNVATVVVGDPQHFLAVSSGKLSEYVQDRPEEMQRFTAFHTLRNGQVRFADSFAKFSLDV